MKQLFIGLLLALPYFGDAQAVSTPDTVAYVVPSVWRLNFLGLGVINEIRLGPKTTLNSSFTVGSVVKASGGSLYPDPNKVYYSYQFFPILETGVRHYYNFERRLEKGKSIRYNSGNYISGRLAYRFSPIIEHYDAGQISNPSAFGIEALWGFQRTYRRNFYLNLALGIGAYAYSAGGSRKAVNSAGDFTIGYTFANK